MVVLATRGSKPSKPSIGGGVGDRTTRIKVDGVSLAAEIVTPPGTGRHPLVVMPAGWGGAATMYRMIAGRLARIGYQVVAYAQRGFGDSSGRIDFAGADTQRDASAVLTWALAHTRSDPNHVGMFGMSYGGGISLLTAAHDKRVRAVVATSGWAQVSGALDANDTPSIAALKVLLNSKHKYDATVQRLRTAVRNSPKDVGGILQSISASRSPLTYVADLNRNKPAIMMANAFEDSILSPGQLVPFFDRLTTPKRLELARGDHGGPEYGALLGAPNPTVDDAVAWLDHYLRGVSNGIDTQQPILLRDINTSAEHRFSAWPQATDHVALGRPSGDASATTWTATLRAGQDSAATTPPPGFATGAIYPFRQVPITNIKADRALIWPGSTATANTEINGTPTVHLSLASSATGASVYAYLYDVARNGMATLVDVAPYTATGLVPGSSRSVTFSMQPMSETLAAGHRLTLVLDPADPRYQSAAPDGTTITVSSSDGDPASLLLPRS